MAVLTKKVRKRRDHESGCTIISDDLQGLHVPQIFKMGHQFTQLFEESSSYNPKSGLKLLACIKVRLCLLSSPSCPIALHAASSINASP